MKKCSRVGDTTAAPTSKRCTIYWQFPLDNVLVGVPAVVLCLCTLSSSSLAYSVLTTVERKSQRGITYSKGNRSALITPSLLHFTRRSDNQWWR